MLQNYKRSIIFGVSLIGGVALANDKNPGIAPVGLYSIFDIAKDPRKLKKLEEIPGYSETKFYRCTQKEFAVHGVRIDGFSCWERLRYNLGIDPFLGSTENYLKVKKVLNNCAYQVATGAKFPKIS